MNWNISEKWYISQSYVWLHGYTATGLTQNQYNCQKPIFPPNWAPVRLTFLLASYRLQTHTWKSTSGKEIENEISYSTVSDAAWNLDRQSLKNEQQYNKIFQRDVHLSGIWG